MILSLSLPISCSCRPPAPTVSETVIKLVYPEPGAAAGIVIRLYPDKDFVRPGENFTVSVLVQPGAGAEVAGVQFDLSFNNQALAVNEINEGPLFQKPPGGSYAGSYFHPGVIDNGSGEIRNVAGAIIGQGQFITGAAVFAEIKCTAVNSLQSSGFSLQNVIVGSREAVSLPLESIINGQVTVVSFHDLNRDGSVNVLDIIVLVNDFGETGAPGWLDGDINRDGIINILDLIMVGQNFS
jgi:hypothetical protein